MCACLFAPLRGCKPCKSESKQPNSEWVCVCVSRGCLRDLDPNEWSVGALMSNTQPSSPTIRHTHPFNTHAHTNTHQHSSPPPSPLTFQGCVGSQRRNFFIWSVRQCGRPVGFVLLTSRRGTIWLRQGSVGTHNAHYPWGRAEGLKGRAGLGRLPDYRLSRPHGNTYGSRKEDQRWDRDGRLKMKQWGKRCGE